MKTNRYPGKDKILNSIVRQVVSASSPEKIILFGSRAKGINGNESDYDICVLKSGIRKRRLVAQKIYRELKVMASVDILVNTLNYFDKKKKKDFLGEKNTKTRKKGAQMVEQTSMNHDDRLDAKSTRQCHKAKLTRAGRADRAENRKTTKSGFGLFAIILHGSK